MLYIQYVCAYIYIYIYKMVLYQTHNVIQDANVKLKLNELY